jgi:hypothetical protein
VPQHGGRFLTLIPRARNEDRAFRESLARGQSRWRPIPERRDQRGESVDRFAIGAGPALSADGYRRAWNHGARQAENDVAARVRQVDRALGELAELQPKRTGPPTRDHEQAKVAAAVEAILEARGVKSWITTTTTITARAVEQSHQEGRGRPRDKTRQLRTIRPR